VVSWISKLKQTTKVMKPIKNSVLSGLVTARVLVLLTALLSLTISSCDDDDNGPSGSTQNIVALAQGNSNLSTLVAALTKYPDLVTTLSSTTTEFTVFAPTNEAFEGLLDAIGQSSLDDIPESVLRDVLEYHVIAGAAVKSTELTAGAIETVNGEDITVSLTGGIKLNGTVNVTTADVEATNGVVHVIDAVLVPPTIVPLVGTIVAPAYFNKNFTTLIAAVKAASPSILTTLLNGTQKTLFAPTNDAFVAAGITTLPDQSTLDAVLAYHVISGAAVEAADIATGSSNATTLNGKIYLSKGSAGVFINGKTKVTATDIQGSNGVVHVIDRTLLPPAKTIAQIVSEYANASSNKQFTKLLQALQRTSGQSTDLLAAAGAAGDLTVFAPTDAAFTALGVDLATVDLATLTKILQHHIVGARVFSSDLSTGSVPTLYKSVNINVTNLTVTGAKAGETGANLQPTLLNIHATNGVVHVIDKVLLPE
jgi:transforming growth factor-beta-induced protein